ncbi:MAG: hypothetical protein E6G76_28950, partial [Alphaproteobacteria bacterium]
MDLAYDFTSSRRDIAAEQTSPRAEEAMLPTRFASPDAVSQSLHKSRNPVKFGLVFIAGAISAILFATISSFLTTPRLKSELDDGSEISLSELMRALRRVDESLKATEPQRYSRPKARAFVAEQRTAKRNHHDQPAGSALPR